MVEAILPAAGARVSTRTAGRAGAGAAAVSVVENYTSDALMHLQEPEAEPDFLMTAEETDADRYYEAPDPFDKPLIDEELPYEVKRADFHPALHAPPGEEARTGGLPGIVAEESIAFAPPAIPEAPSLEQPVSAPLDEGSGAGEEADYKEATDPWDDPLPAWEYSANEYPVLLGSNESSSWKKFLVPAAAVLLLVAAGAVYLLIYKTSAESQGTPATEIALANEAPAQSEPPASDGRAAAAEQPQQSPAPESAPAISAEAAQPAQVAPEAESAGGAFSLQAASFPDEVEARRLSEHLIGATVPARVVAVDLGRRGRWYRVRVGRFASAADAEKYAVQARERAARHGMNVPLIVCDHEKP